MALDIPGGLFQQRDVRETPASTQTQTQTNVAPIGAIFAWLKSFTNTPALIDGWVECDGSVLSDADSVYNGQTLPDLNGSEFLRGNTTSGGTGGGTSGSGSSHTHTQSGSVSSHTLIESEMPSHTHTVEVIGGNPTDGSNIAEGSSEEGVTFNSGSTGGGGGHTHTDTFSNANESSHTHASQPKFFDVVWIMRVK